MPDPDRPRRKHRTDPPPLSAREVRFCQLWVETGNATQSYISAGFTKPPASPNAANVRAARLLRKAQVRAYIRYLQHVAAEAAKVSVEEIAAALANLAKADRRKLYEDGRLLPPDEWPDDVAAAVEAIETDEIFEPDPNQKGRRRLAGHTRKVKTASRLAAWAKLAEWKRMLGQDKADGARGTPAPLVVGGEADPGKL